jgi:H+-translocating NAD(P) transhydrogenase subunit beta
VVTTLLVRHPANLGWIAAGVAVGTVAGVPAARKVKMTAMPQMVALFNGVGGGAVAIIAWVEFRSSAGFTEVPGHVAASSVFAALVGSISFWGSSIAFGKLQGLISGGSVRFGALHGPLTLTVLAATVGAGTAVVLGWSSGAVMIAFLTGAAVFAVAGVLPIGGADMPVVISLLNAMTGLSAAAIGLALDNSALIVAGMLVGASGSLLTHQMAVAMNRSIGSVLAGGFGGGAAAGTGPAVEGGVARATSASDVAIQMAYARQVVIVPGYGMAVSQAQHAVRELSEQLRARGVEVKYAIHPVAGRMPGHMNVLLAEADVPFEQLKEMDEINGEFSRTDVSLVIGANDVTNPDARTRPDSPIYGMPILDVEASSSVIVLKRSMSSGYAGVHNPLFTNPKTAMLFGDAKASVGSICDELKAV